jgi:hypothetical protein
MVTLLMIRLDAGLKTILHWLDMDLVTRWRYFEIDRVGGKKVFLPAFDDVI